MKQIMDNMDIIFYVLENGITGLLTANICLLLVVNHKGNHKYKYHLFFYNLITMAGLCALTLIQHKPYPSYEFTDWKSPLFFFGLAAVTCVLCTSFIGIRYNIVPLTLIPFCSIAILAAEYFLRPYANSPRRLYFTEFHAVYERIGIAMLVLSLFLIFLRFQLYKKQGMTQIYLASTLTGLGFASETAKDFILAYLPMLLAADLLISLIHALFKHRNRIHLVKHHKGLRLPLLHRHARRRRVNHAKHTAKTAVKASSPSHSPQSTPHKPSRTSAALTAGTPTAVRRSSTECIAAGYPLPPKAVGSSDSLSSLTDGNDKEDKPSNVISLASVRKPH